MQTNNRNEGFEGDELKSEALNVEVSIIFSYENAFVLLKSRRHFSCAYKATYKTIFSRKLEGETQKIGENDRERMEYIQKTLNNAIATLMGTLTVTWMFLDINSKPTLKPKSSRAEESVPKQQKSSARVVNNVCNILIFQLPKSCVKGDMIVIVIREYEYYKWVESCRHNLHRIIV